MKTALSPQDIEMLTEEEKSAMARGPSAYMNVSEGAKVQPGPTRSQERAAFFESNPVMRQMREKQDSAGLQEDVVPPSQPIGNQPEEAFRPEVEAPLAARDVSQRPPARRTYSPEQLAGPQASQQAPSLQQLPGEGLMRQGYEKKRQGTFMEQAAKADAADQEAAFYGQAAEEQEDANEEYQEKLMDLEAYRTDTLKRADSVRQAMAEKDIDYDRFWNSRSTGQKVLLGVGAFLSGLGGNSENYINTIQSFIDRDIEEQKEKYNQMGDNAKNMVSIMSQIYEPGVEAAEGARMMALESIKAKLNAKLKTTQSKQARAQIPKLIGAIDIEQGKAANAIAIKRLEAQDKAKSKVKLGSEAARAIGQGIDALDAVNTMEKYIRETGGGKWDRLAIIGDNPFSDARRKYTLFVGFMNSGANVPEGEKADFNATIPTLMDSPEMVKKKLQDAKKILKRRIDIFGMGAGYGKGEVFDVLKQGKDPRVKTVD